MRPGTSPRTVSSSSVTNCILTTYYWTCRAASPHYASLLRRSGADDYGHAGKHLAGISCSPAVLDRSYHRTFPEIRFKFTPSQARQRWAERPVHPLLSLLDSVSYPSHIPPTPSPDDPLAPLRPSLLRLVECPGLPRISALEVFVLHRRGGYCTHQQALRNTVALASPAAVEEIYAAPTDYRAPIIAKSRRQPTPTIRNEVPHGEAPDAYL